MISKEPIGVLRADHTLELAGEPDRLQGGTGARGGLHDGAQASELSPFSAQSGPRSRRPPRCLPACSTGQRRWPDGGCRIASHPEVDMVSFTAPRAPVSRWRAMRRPRQARAPGTGRQVAQHHPGGCRFQARHHCRRARRDDQFRPVLQCAHAHAGANSRMAEALAIAKEAAEHHGRCPRQRCGAGRDLGHQWDKIQTLIHKASRRAPRGGRRARQAGRAGDWLLREATVLAVKNNQAPWRVKRSRPGADDHRYDTVDQAIAIGNDTPMAWPPMSRAPTSRPRARWRPLRAGSQHQQRRAGPDGTVRWLQAIGQWPRVGDHAFAEFLEVKALLAMRPRRRPDIAPVARVRGRCPGGRQG